MYTALFWKMLLSGKTADNFETLFSRKGKLGTSRKHLWILSFKIHDIQWGCQAGLLSVALVLYDPFCQWLYYLKGTVSYCILTYAFFFRRMGIQPHLVLTNLTMALPAFLFCLPTGWKSIASKIGRIVSKSSCIIKESSPSGLST